MSYSKVNLKYAAEVIAERKITAELVYNQRRAEIIKKFPEIGEYIKQISDINLKIFDAVGDRENFERRLGEIAETNERVQKIIEKKLIENGYPANYLEIPYTCKKCADSGYVDGITCSCRIDLLNQLNVRDLESASPAKDCRFDNFSLQYYSNDPDSSGNSPRETMNYIFDYCKAYADDFSLDSISLCLSGATGLGKTHLSLAIGNVAAKKGYSVFYSSAQNLIAGIEREKFSVAKSSHAEDKALNCDLLIIDDLGSEFVTQFVISEVYNILNTRINCSKPTIISTNLSAAELAERYTERITSRIIGNYYYLHFVGQDIRQIKKVF